MFNVFTNKDEAVKVPDVIIDASGALFTNYDLSPEAATPENIRLQLPNSKAYQLTEIPFDALPAFGAVSWATGRGFYYPSNRGAVLPTDPIVTRNANYLSDKVANEAFTKAVNPTGLNVPLSIAGIGTPSDLQTILSQYHVSQATVTKANQEVPGKVKSLADAYIAQLKREANDLGNIIGQVYLSIIGAVVSIIAPPVGALYAAQQGAMRLGYQAASGQKVTVQEIALTEGPALAGAGLSSLAPVAGESSSLLSVRNVSSDALAAQLGLKAEPLVSSYTAPASLVSDTSAASSVSSQASSTTPLWYNAAEKTVAYGPVAATAGPSVIGDLAQGKIGAAFADLARGFGIPIPKSIDTGSGVTIKGSQPVTQLAGSAGGGSTNMEFTPADPASPNVLQWIVGAALLTFFLILFLRK
ncbi:MAG: hypothetical protein KGL39_39485 [Patescibacteria group bacterium]|nr:hypothetical protein [Patescibacteria group bacterium]